MPVLYTLVLPFKWWSKEHGRSAGGTRHSKESIQCVRAGEWIQRESVEASEGMNDDVHEWLPDSDNCAIPGDRMMWMLMLTLMTSTRMADVGREFEKVDGWVDD